MNKSSKQVQGELIYGIHPVVEVLKAKRRKVISIYTTRPEPKSWSLVAKILPKHVQIQYVAREVLNKMAETTDHQGVVAWVQPFVLRKKFFDPNNQRYLLMLDGIQDTRNVGAILRSAYCVGVDGVIMCKKGGAPINASTLKASAGLAEYMEIYEAASPESAVQLLKDVGYTIYLATLGGENARHSTYQEPLCLVIGNEAVGISKSILKSGKQITLPQRMPEISYNASVAAGILLFLIGTQSNKI
ncbi:RNA methyltransferase [Candidatus Dependentiae bacterium]|nr:RNA methyltransferase [Candidatus Dependentiae bacterium]